MSKLIGTNPNQVPSNADLGTAAFMDKKDFLLSKGSSLSAIDAVIPKNARDVVIYDTSKDSDGGAWRKRIQHTSWYNEKLNTTTRGSRREFPAVAVIVAEYNKVTIYDGDDPALPMWMVFNLATSFMVNLAGTTRTIRAVSALNAFLVVPLNDGANNGTIIINFIEDFGYEIGSGYRRYGTSHKIIKDRNVNSTIFITFSTIGLVSGNSNDVAMTVLPNAPIDPATGLPMPTIAVATDGGVSVIKDDGTVVDLTNTLVSDNQANHVNFTESQGISYISRNGRVYYSEYETIPSSDTSAVPDTVLNPGQSSAISGISLFPGGDTNAVVVAGSKRYIGRGEQYAEPNGGVSIADLYGKSSATNGYNLNSAVINSTYNTGWMPGNIKLATLSDTDSADVTSTELVTNGTFDSDTSGWTVGAGWSINNAKLYHTGAGSRYDQYNIPVVVGKRYTVSATMRVISGTSNTSFQIYMPSSGNLISGAITTSGAGGGYTKQLIEGETYTHTYTFVATSTTIHIGGYSSDTFEIDDISVSLAEPDRSVNGKGLQVFGTVKKTPVASGADLVAYSGFNASNGTAPTNYLLQPYNSDLEFGTGDFSVMGWFKTSDASVVRNIVSRYITSAPNATFSGFNISILTDGTLYFYTMEANGNSTTPTSGQGVLDDNIWHHFVGIRRSSGNIQIYVDGKSYSSVYATVRNINVASQQSALRFGWHYGNDQNSIENLALLRISPTIPSEEQIKKIYEDEKHLFQENAKATLYGTSDAVTALAYDEDTNLLHVGTSAGRSVFQGLRRVDNTTRAVGTAISAVDGFVVEE